MTRLVALSFVLVLAASLSGCKKNKGTCPGGAVSCGQACRDDAAGPACGQACGLGAPCPGGFYCTAEDECTADCTADKPCPDDGICRADGRCTPAMTTSDGGDAMTMQDANVPDDAAVCARQSVNATRVTPNVIFIIDRSGSMERELNIGDGIQCGDNACMGNNEDHSCYCGNNDEELSRWRGLRNVLVGNGSTNRGLIGELEGSVRFGMTLYSEFTNQNGQLICPSVNNLSPGATPQIVAVEALGQAINEIAPSYLMREPRSGTPTGESIALILSALDPTLVNGDEPTIFILATDGEPALCSDLSNTGTTAARNRAVQEVENAFEQGIRTFVIAVADEEDLNQAHIDDLANAGLGRSGADPQAESWRVTSVSELEDAINGIVGSEISCEVTLEGMVTDISDGCSGGEVVMVSPGGQRTTIPCDNTSSNGWRLTSNTTFEIFGQACMSLKQTPGVTLEASFPCGSVIIID